MCDVSNAFFTADTSFSTVSNGILFGMHCGLLMAVAYNASVFTARKKSIVALTDNTVCFYKKTSDLKSLAWAARSGDLYNFFEVFIPRGS